MHDQIIHTHGDKINADSVVHAAFNRNFDFGANTVIGSNKDGIFETCRFQIKKPAKPTNLGIGTRTPCRTHQWFDLIDQCVASIDIDTCIGIGETILAR